MMLLRAFLYCCVASCYWVVPAFADDLQQIQARLASGQGDTAQLLQDVNVFLQQSPNHFEALFLKARLLEKNEQFALAEEVYRETIVSHPNAPEPYNNLARLLVKDGKLAEAQSLLETAMHTHPGYATIYDNLSQIYVAMARNSYGKALQLNAANSPISLASLNIVGNPSAGFENKTPGSDTSNSETSPSLTPIQKDSENIAPIVLASTNQKPSASKSLQDRDEIITTLQGWAAAWSEQATDVYFIFYADDYHPPGQSRIAWKKERRVRLNKPSWIQIGLEGINIKSISNEVAKVELIQEYRASNYQDKTRKELKLRQTEDGWRIVEERNLAKIN